MKLEGAWGVGNKEVAKGLWLCLGMCNGFILNLKARITPICREQSKKASKAYSEREVELGFVKLLQAVCMSSLGISLMAVLTM